MTPFRILSQNRIPSNTCARCIHKRCVAGSSFRRRHQLRIRRLLLQARHRLPRPRPAQQQVPPQRRHQPGFLPPAVSPAAMGPASPGGCLPQGLFSFSRGPRSSGGEYAASRPGPDARRELNSPRPSPAPSDRWWRRRNSWFLRRGLNTAVLGNSDNITCNHQGDPMEPNRSPEGRSPCLLAVSLLTPPY